jgi:GTP-binding protein
MLALTEPTLKISLSPNTSPFAGKEGEFVTIRQIEDRLKRELKTNIGLKLEPLEKGIGFMVSGRGELHLSVLIEAMRREGFELEIGKPEVVIKEIDGIKHEPFEELTIEIEAEYVGVIMEELGKRYAKMIDSLTDEKNVTRMVFEISSRNLLGFRSQILTKTRGNGIFASRFLGFRPLAKARPKLRNGVLIASESGVVTSYALESVQQRGEVFVKPGDQVYMGQIVGLGKVPQDIEVNVCKAKKLTNFRSNADIATVLKPPMVLSLEQALDFLEDDELLEVTPQALRLRKKLLDPNQSVKAKKRNNQESN